MRSTRDVAKRGLLVPKQSWIINLTPSPAVICQAEVTVGKSLQLLTLRPFSSHRMRYLIDVNRKLYYLHKYSCICPFSEISLKHCSPLREIVIGLSMISAA